MPSPENTYSWAQKVCEAAFRERGEPLREGDSIILVAAVFRACLDGWLVENADVLDKHRKEMEAAAGVWKAELAGTLERQGQSLRAGLEDDLSAASFSARQAVDKALSISGRTANGSTEWKDFSPVWRLCWFLFCCIGSCRCRGRVFVLSVPFPDASPRAWAARGAGVLNWTVPNRSKQISTHKRGQ